MKRDVRSLKIVNQPVPKKDAQALLTGKPVYTADMTPKDCLVIKLLRSPHAFAKILSIDKSKALKVEGIVAVFTYEDVPQNRFTIAGQSYPEPSPYDRMILDQWVRYVGDPVAIVVGENEQAAIQAMRRIKVEYEVLEPVLDPTEAIDNPILVHPEDDWRQLVPNLGGDAKRNLCASNVESEGDVEATLADCDVVIDTVYRTQACQQAMMETFRAFAYLDTYGRLNIVASTQVPFHVRRIVGTALGWPHSKIRVIKPRIGGGFGAKQTAVCEVYPAFVTAMTGRPSQIIFSREESMVASTPRHPMQMHIRLGASSDGRIRAIDLHTLSDTGAYGEHGPTTVGLSGHKSISLYPKLESWRFSFDVVYTNHMGRGAYRGYGATQGIFAVESAIDELAAKLKMDPSVLRERNMVQPGDAPKSYDGGPIDSCCIGDCLAAVKKKINWEENYPRRVMPDGKIRAVGCALAMQGSGIAGLDTASARLNLNDDGTYALLIGATDMGTGCDTILAQMAAEVLDCDFEAIVVHAADTDISPYDKGSYASSTTYVTGNAVVRAATELKEQILATAAQLLSAKSGRAVEPADLILAHKEITGVGEFNDLKISLAEVGNQATISSNQSLTAQATFSSKTSPPPLMAGAAEIEYDPLTGVVKVLRYAAGVDCGTVINPNLARVQTEGALVQAIGMTLYEIVAYTDRGQPQSNSFLQYKIPSRLDVPEMSVDFFSSYEQSGPFGAKSIGELVINTPAPAIANAIANACGARMKNLPILPEHILRATGALQDE